jgi:hypothetical protein
MLYYDINYYHNRLFLINSEYYVYIYVTKNNHIYDFNLINNDLYLYINHKNKRIRENFCVKIIHKNKEIKLHMNGQKEDHINLGNIYKLNYKNDFDDIIIENIFDNLFSNFDIEYYTKNNKFLDTFDIHDENMIKFIKYHWYLSGQYNPQMKFKYILKKYESIIFNLKYNFIGYDDNKKNTLLFIDDRYDPIFLYILILFLYSVDETWNITVFTKEENKIFFQNDFDKLKINGKINIIKDNLKNAHEYSKLLMKPSFWNSIKEENCLIFQYDSFCMGKFNPIFLNYNYIGAQWPHTPCFDKKIKIGNGGTSFRKVRIMEKICNKYSNETHNCIEDIFFPEKLYIDHLLDCTLEIADMFSFENIFNNNSIYAHQIYNTIELSEIDNFMYNKIIKMN